MVRIRLMRTGKKGQPSFRIVVKEQRTTRDGEYLENLGHYLPLTSPKTFVLNKEAYDRWIAKGAQPSQTVADLVRKHSA